MSINSYVDVNNNKIYGDLSLNQNVNIQCVYPVSAGGGANIAFFAGKSSNVKIEFHGANSLVFIGDNVVFHGEVKLRLVSDSVVYIGDNTTIVDGRIDAYETKNVFIGNDCMFSNDVLFTTTDSHGIYNYENNRVNHAKSIYVGDHCWLGMYAKCLKGSKIHSGSVLGACSLLTKKIYSNQIWAGNPTKMVKNDSYWQRDLHVNTNVWTRETIKNYKPNFSDDFKYSFSAESFLDFDFIEASLDKLETAQSKLEFLYNAVYCNNDKNRFALFEDSKPISKAKKIQNKFSKLDILEPLSINYS